MNLNIRGTHGTGKTTITRRLREEHPHELLYGPSPLHGKNFRKAIATRFEGGLYVVGREQGGLDGIYPQEIVEDLLRHYAPLGHIVWENVLVSANVGRWARLAHELEPVNHAVWAFLTTPYEVCLERIRARRAAAAAAGFRHRQGAAGIKEDVLAAHWRRTRRCAGRAHTAGIDVRWLPYEHAYEHAHDLLVRAGWECAQHGLLLPQCAELDRWAPTPEELEKVIKYAVLPWEDPPVKIARRTSRLRTDTVIETAPVPDEQTDEIDVLDDPFTDLGDCFD